MTDAEFSSHRSKIPYMALRARVTEADHEASVRGHVNVIAWEAVDEGPTAENGSTEIIGITIETIIENGVAVGNVIAEEEAVRTNTTTNATSIATQNRVAKDHRETIWSEALPVEGSGASIVKRIANANAPGIDIVIVLNFMFYILLLIGLCVSSALSRVYTTTVIVLTCINTHS